VWGQGQAPTSELLVLTSIPRVSLQVAEGLPIWDIPVQPPNLHALNALAFLFRGPPSTEHPSQATIEEAACARYYYFRYLHSQPEFWAHVVRTAQIVALKETALAAINLIDAIIQANWAPCPSATGQRSENVYEVPSEARLEEALGYRGTLPIAPTGAISLLSGAAQATVLPYLLRPPQTFGTGDQQSAAYAVAVAKHTALVHLDCKLKEAMTVPELEPYLARSQSIIDQIAQCAVRGVWGGIGAVGSRVETLEM
jgi:hypothetical protein